MEQQIGKSGVVINDTTSTWTLFETDGKLVVVPKKGSNFDLRYRQFSFRVFGDHWIGRKPGMKSGSVHQTQSNNKNERTDFCKERKANYK